MSDRRSAALRLYLPFIAASALLFGVFAAFVVLKFRRYEVPVLQNEILGIFFAFMLVYSAATLGLLAFFFDKIVRVSAYAGDRLKDVRPAALREDASGLFASLIASIDGMSDRLHERIRAAEEEKNRVLALLESMNEGVMVVENGQKIVLANSALARSLGIRRDEVEGRLFWEVLRDADLNEMIRQALSRQTAIRKEHAMALSEAVYEIRISPVFGENGFYGVVAVFYEVTQIKQLEKARSEFVANVSHELKTPLTSIMGFVETLKEGAIDDPKNRMRFLGIIEDHSRKLHRLIEDLLHLSSVESGKLEIRPQRIDLAGLLNELSESFARPLAARKLVLHQSAPPAFSLIADPKFLEEVLSVLIDNAIKYNKPGGEIFIEAAEDLDASHITVRDTGIGIPDADQPRIFERFYRVDKSRSSETGGTGLGLSIAKHLIDQHGGRIAVKSVWQQGSAFTVSFPKIN